jgi:hypothetical protein
MPPLKDHHTKPRRGYTNPSYSITCTQVYIILLFAIKMWLLGSSIPHKQYRFLLTYRPAWAFQRAKLVRIREVNGHKISIECHTLKYTL